MTLPAAATTASSAVLAANIRKPPADPGKWTLEDATNVVAARTSAWIETARLFVVDGDHWQRGLGWIGPAPLPSEAGFQETMSLIERGFTSRNVLLEITKRYASGVVGHEPAWSLVPNRPMKPDDKPTAEEQTLIDEANAALTSWWDRYGIASLFWQAVFQMTWGQRGPVRLYLSTDAFTPAAVANGNGNGSSSSSTPTRAARARTLQKRENLEDALSVILLDVPKLEAATVYVDPDTGRQVGVYLFESSDGQQGAELVYTDQNGKTLMKTLGAGAHDPIPADLTGHLPHHEIARPTRLLTDAAFSLQRALNLALSVAPRTIVSAGFLERVLLNAKLPGKYVDNGSGGKVWQPDPNMRFGAGTTVQLQGDIVEDNTGKKSLTNADVKWREPSDVRPIIEAAAGIYEKLLEECSQAHVMLSSEAAPSGRSRREARADYEASLEEGKLPIEAAGRWLIGAALALAEHVSGTPGRYTKPLRARFDLRLNAGPAEPEDRAQNLAEWEKGARSIESVMLGAGITDPDAEQAQISREPGARLEIAKRQAEALTLWLDAGADVPLAAEIVGLDPTFATKLAAARKKAQEEARKAAQEADGGTGGDNGGTEDGNNAGGQPTDG